MPTDRDPSHRPPLRVFAGWVATPFRRRQARVWFGEAPSNDLDVEYDKSAASAVMLRNVRAGLYDLELHARS
jgi:hypothetical protein